MHTDLTTTNTSSNQLAVSGPIAQMANDVIVRHKTIQASLRQHKAETLALLDQLRGMPCNAALALPAPLKPQATDDELCNRVQSIQLSTQTFMQGQVDGADAKLSAQQAVSDALAAQLRAQEEEIRQLKAQVK